MIDSLIDIHIARVMTPNRANVIDDAKRVKLNKLEETRYFGYCSLYLSYS